MDAYENKKLDMKWIEIVNSRDMNSLEKLADEIYASDCVYHNPGFPNLHQGLEGLKQWQRQIYKDWPDFQVLAEDFIAEDDKVVCYGMCIGVNELTGKRLNMRFIHISRYLDGKLVEEWELDVPVPLPVS